MEPCVLPFGSASPAAGTKLSTGRPHPALKLLVLLDSHPAQRRTVLLLLAAAGRHASENRPGGPRVGKVN